MTKTSFGKYFDDQRDRIVKDMQNNKNTEDRKSVAQGKSVDLGGRRIIKKK